MKEAQNYVKIAFGKYRQIYGFCADSTILSHWLLLQQDYGESRQEDDSVIKLADSLQAALYARDQRIIQKHWKERVGHDQLKDIYRIKINCIVTIVLETTRRLENEQAQLLESFCDNILLSQKDSKHTFNSLAQQKKQNVDLLSIKRIRLAPIRKDKATDEFFLGLYRKTVKISNHFAGFYKSML